MHAHNNIIIVLILYTQVMGQALVSELKLQPLEDSAGSYSGTTCFQFYRLVVQCCHNLTSL